MKQRAGRIQAAGETFDVAFEPVTGQINEAIDAAYQAKYTKSPYLMPMVSERARAATVRVTPRAAGK